MKRVKEVLWKEISMVRSARREVALLNRVVRKGPLRRNM